MIRKLTRISPASCVAMVALFVALGGVSYAAVGQIGTAEIKNGAVTKKKIRKDAVTGAKVKESTLGIVPNAAKLDGKEPSAFESKGFASPAEDFVNLASNTVTTVASQSLPAGTYLVLARGAINNNGGEDLDAGEECSLTAGNGSQTVQFGALAKNGQPGDREEFSLQVIATLASPGDAVLSCDTTSSWKTGNVTTPSVVAVSLQP